MQYRLLYWLCKVIFSGANSAMGTQSLEMALTLQTQREYNCSIQRQTVDMTRQLEFTLVY